MTEKLGKLLEVKSLVTLALTISMVAILLGDVNPQSETLALFCTSYGAVITYFFTKKDSGTSGESQTSVAATSTSESDAS